MTQPTPHGYPDYNRTQARADKLLLNQNTTNTNGTTIYNLGFIGDQPYLGFFLSSGIQGNVFTFDFFPDSTFAFSQANYGFSLPLNGSAVRSLPVQGPYARLRIVQGAVGATHFARVWTLSEPMIPGVGGGTQNVLVSATAQAINAGATQTFDSLLSSPGEAYWQVTSGSGSWRATLNALLADGTTQAITSLQSVNTQINAERNVFLPATCYRVSITNNGAGAANFDTYLTARPIENGS